MAQRSIQNLLLLSLCLLLFGCKTSQIAPEAARISNTDTPLDSSVTETVSKTDDHGIPAPSPEWIVVAHTGNYRFSVQGLAGAALPNAEVHLEVQEGTFAGETCVTLANELGEFECSIRSDFNVQIDVWQTLDGKISPRVQVVATAPGTAGKGSALKRIGDFDGDGREDIAIRRHFTREDGTFGIELAIFDAGLCEINASECIPKRIIQEPQRGASFASVGIASSLNSVLGNLDLNGDGYKDLLVGSTGYSFGKNLYAGAIFGYAGGPCPESPCGELILVIHSPLSSFTDFAKSLEIYEGGNDSRWLLAGLPDDPTQGQVAIFDLDACLAAYQAGDLRCTPKGYLPIPRDAIKFGSLIRNLGDINGDQKDEIAVSFSIRIELETELDGALPKPGTEGSSNLLGTVSIYENLDCLNICQSEIQMKHLYGRKPGGYFGFEIASLGDINADGLSDFAITDPWYTIVNELGRVIKVGEIRFFVGNKENAFTSAGRIVGDKADSGFGNSVVRIGDFNGNGVADVAASEAFWRKASGELLEGRVHVYDMNCGLIPCTFNRVLTMVSPEWTTQSNNFGFSIEAVSDLDQDGFDDLLIVDPEFRNSDGLAGRVYRFSGSLTSK